MLALLRVQNIELGIVAALLLNIFLWPFHAKIRVVTTCAKATDKLTKLYLSLSRFVLFCPYLHAADNASSKIQTDFAERSKAFTGNEAAV